MTLITSISGIRGTIGNQVGENLTPLDIVKYTSAYGTWLSNQNTDNQRIVIGRDARISGSMVSGLVINTLKAQGWEVINLGLSTTPTVELAVINEKAAGGIIITASHNPKNWNALKLLNHRGEFISVHDGLLVLQIAESGGYYFSDINNIGKEIEKNEYLDFHINHILNLKMVKSELIATKNYKIVVDGVNSSGGIFVPALLNKLGVKNVIKLNCEPTGVFAHDPEPVQENLQAICKRVIEEKADLGIVVDPDVDRLVFVTEKGDLFGEEYTLVAIADYILGSHKGATVSNLSSTRALKDVAQKHGVEHFASAVGEVHVVEKMKSSNAVIGGEGNGGIIYPESHYGRDALVGIGLFLSHLANFNGSISQLRAEYPDYAMLKKKVSLTADIDMDILLANFANLYEGEQISRVDGVKVDFENAWIHLRKSNTEPIIRIYTEANSVTKANELAEQAMSEIKNIVSQTAKI